MRKDSHSHMVKEFFEAYSILKSSKKKKKRVDLDVRPIGPFAKNYDYGEPGLGTGLYRGPMDRYKSVTEFLNKSRKSRNRKRKLLDLYNAKS